MALRRHRRRHGQQPSGQDLLDLIDSITSAAQGTTAAVTAISAASQPTRRRARRVIESLPPASTPTPSTSPSEPVAQIDLSPVSNVLDGIARETTPRRRTDTPVTAFPAPHEAKPSEVRQTSRMAPALDLGAIVTPRRYDAARIPFSQQTLASQATRAASAAVEQALKHPEGYTKRQYVRAVLGRREAQRARTSVRRRRRGDYGTRTGESAQPLPMQDAARRALDDSLTGQKDYDLFDPIGGRFGVGQDAGNPSESVYFALKPLSATPPEPTQHTDRFSNYAPKVPQFIQNFSRALIGASPNESDSAELAHLGQTIGLTAIGGAAGKAIETAQAARAARGLVAGAADYGPYALRAGLEPTAATAGRAGFGTAAYTERAQRLAAAARASRGAPAGGNLASRTARGLSMAARGRYVSAARAARRAQRGERAFNALNPVSLAALGTKQGQALAQGTAEALNPTDGSLGDTLHTTLRGAAGTFTFPITVAADTVNAIRTGDTGPLEGAGNELIGSVTGLAPLFSGDAEQVRQTIQDDYGLFALPVAPKILSGRVGAAIRDRVSPLAERAKGTPTGKINAEPGAFRRLGQVVGGRDTRRTVAEIFQRNTGASRRHSDRVSLEIERELRQAEGARSLRDNLHGPEPGDLLNTVARFGISRENPLEQLAFVNSRLDHGRAGESAFGVADAWKYATEHPEVLRDEHFWNAVDIYKKRAEEVTTSERGRRLGQAHVFGVTPADQVTPFPARPFTKAKTKEAAHADLEATREKVKNDRAQAASMIAEAKTLTREREVYRVADARRGVNKAQKRSIAAQEKRKAAWEAKRDKAKPGSAGRKLAEDRIAHIERRLADLRHEKASPAALRRVVRAAQLRRDAKALYAQAKAESERAGKLQKALDPYTRPGTKPSTRTKRLDFTDAEVAEFNRTVDEIAASHPLGAFEKPSVVSEREALDPATVGQALSAGRPRRQQISNFRMGAEDRVDRSLRATLDNSVARPRMQRAVNGAVQEAILHELNRRGPTKLADGREVFEATGEEWAKAVRDKIIDTRDVVFLPSTNYKWAILDGVADLTDISGDINKRLTGEILFNEGRRGTKYVAVSREFGKELADQLSPRGGALERALNAVSKPMTRLILMSPVWVQAQVIAELLQAGAAVGPTALVRAWRDLERTKRDHQAGYEGFADLAGESTAALNTPHAFRTSYDDHYAQMSDIGKALRRTAPGRALYATGTGQIFALFDRYKSGKYRQAVLAAKLDKDLKRFMGGVQGMTREQERLSKKLAPMSREERIAYVGEHPEEFRDLMRYLNDTQGNWDAFTRFERAFAPALIFYPYIRMGLRWTFWSFPKEHPAKAQVLYLLSQRNAEEIDKLTGGSANFLDYAVPVIHGTDGEVAGVLPAGQRFGAPGLNSIVQAVGTGNITSALQMLNPALATANATLTGNNPLTGVQEVPPNAGILDHLLYGAQQLFSMPAPVRLGKSIADAVDPGEQSAPDAFTAEVDPMKQIRSFVTPFAPQSAAGFAQQSVLRQAYRDAALGTRSEGSQFIAFPEVQQYIQTGDETALNEALSRITQAKDAKEYIKTTLEGYGSATQEERIQAAIDAFYAAQNSAMGYGSSTYGGGSNYGSGSSSYGSSSSGGYGSSTSGYGSDGTAEAGAYTNMLKRSAAGAP